MKIGAILEHGGWLQETDGPEEMVVLARTIKKILDDVAARDGYVLGKMEVIPMGPDAERVPQPPQGVIFLVVEAIVTGHTLRTRGRFSDELDAKDLERLITVLKRVYPHYNPGKLEPSREQCIQWIDENGPDAAFKVLREQVGTTLQ